jgi:SOS-response transcriptional repressor LexA
VQRLATGRFKPDERIKRIAILSDVSDRAFCVRATDDGMRPWILKGDLLIVDPAASIEPGTPTLVLVNSGADESKAPLILVRDIHFKSSDLENYQLRLVSRNDAYPSLDVSDKISAKLLGPIVGLHRVGSVAAAN